MPTYQYRCNSCLKEFERFQGIKDLPIKKCPFCFKKSLDRLIGSGSAVIFKGWFPGEEIRKGKFETEKN